MAIQFTSGAPNDPNVYNSAKKLREAIGEMQGQVQGGLAEKAFDRKDGRTGKDVPLLEANFFAPGARSILDLLSGLGSPKGQHVMATDTDAQAAIPDQGPAIDSKS